MSYLLDMNKLEVGDIIVTKDKTPTSGFIRIATLSNVSHAMLYVETGCIIHALSGDGVRSDNTQRLLFKSPKDATCLRLINDSDRQVLMDACNYVRGQSWKSYSKVEAAKTQIPFVGEDASNKQFCSRLVAVAFEQAGVKLVKNSAYCTPNDLLKSSKLKVISDVLRKASPKEIEFAESDSPLDKQVKVNKEIMAFARQITGEDLQTDEQVIEYLKVNPEHDKAITNKYRSSGYFDFWKYEMKKNPWRYDPILFVAHFSEKQMESAAKFEVQEAQKYTVLYKMAKDRYTALFNETDLLIAEDMVQLCDDLMMMNIKRYEAAFSVLTII